MLDPHHESHKYGECNCLLVPGDYGFFPQERGKGVKVYQVHLPFCPCECNEQFIDDCQNLSDLWPLIDLQKSAMKRLLPIRFYITCQENLRGR